MNTVRLLLICPRFPESFWSYEWAINEILPGKKATNTPLGLATIAALCPADWQVEIADENVESLPLEPDADIIGICGMQVQYSRQMELVEHYRSRGYYVIVGGSYASLCPERYDSLADSVIAGEAEYVFPQFCRDFELGQPKPFYQETGTVELSDSPTPRFDLLKLDRYHRASLQFSRGCPFRCEFCDIIIMFGRKPRTKEPEQISRELDALRQQDVRNVFFVDDNFIGNMPLAKSLLGHLRTYQETRQFWFNFGTEATLNMAQHPDLLQLFRAANFTWVFIGVESTDPESLKETLKTQNLHEDILTSIQRVYSYGIDVIAGLIVGFDHDSVDCFEGQYQFITKAGIVLPMVSLLIALPKTPLHERLMKEGRVIPLEDVSERLKSCTNIVPLGMSYEELVGGHAALYRRLLSDKEIATRIKNKLSHMSDPVYAGGYSTQDSLKIMWHLIFKGIVPGGAKRWWHFLRSLPFLHPKKIPVVTSDWVAVLSMRAFAERWLMQPGARGQKLP